MLGYTPQEWLSASPGFGLKIMPKKTGKATRESEAVIAGGKEGVTNFAGREKTQTV